MLKTIHLQPESIRGYSNKLRWHQKRTAELIQNKDVVVNVFPTGSGKTRAAQAAFDVLKPDLTLTIAPTNELVSQHVSDWQKHLERENISADVVKVTSEELEKLRNKYGERSHGAALNEKLFRSERTIVVSNPDIIHYILSFSYSKDSSMRELYAQILNAEFWIFDEFHVYDEAQVLSFGILLSQISLTKQLGGTNHKKILVMSATPSETIKNMLEESKINYEVVSPEDEPSDLPKIPILSPVELEIISGTIEKYINDNIKWIQKGLQNSLDYVVISDSIKRVSECREILRKNSIDSKLIVGPSSSTEREKAVSSHFILATPTVDIGFNFSKTSKERQNVDVLFFEAQDANSFIQRLGRLGRIHGKKITNSVSKGIAFVNEKYVKNFQSLPTSMSRREFNDHVKMIMGEKGEEFRHYYNKWGHVTIGITLQNYKKMLTTEAAERAYSLLRKIMVNVFETHDVQKYPERYFFLRLFEEYFPYSSSFFHFLKNSLESKSVPNTLRESFLRYFLEHCCGTYLRGEVQETEEPIIDDFFSNLGKYNRVFQMLEVDKHAWKYFNFLKNMFSFRDSLNIPVALYDPQSIITDETKFFLYELIPLVRGYKIEMITKKIFPSHVRMKKPLAYYKVTGIRKNEKIYPKFIIRKPKGSKKIFIPEEVKVTFYSGPTAKSIGVESDVGNMLTNRGLVCMALSGLASEKLRIFASKMGIYTYKATINEEEKSYSSNVLFGEAALKMSWFKESENDEGVTFWDIFA